MRKCYLLFLLIAQWSAVYAQKPQLMTPFSHAQDIMAVACSPDSKYVLTGGGNLDNTALLWTSEGRLVKILRGHDNAIADVEFSPDGQYMLTLEAKTGTLHMWDKQGQLQRVLKDLHLTNVCFLPDGKQFAGGDEYGGLRLYDLNGKVGREFEAAEASITDIAISNDGQHLAAANLAGIIRVYGLSDGTLERALDGHGQQPVLSVGFLPDGAQLVSGGDDKMALLWNLSDGSIAQKMGPRENTVESVAVSPDGQYIATASRYDTLAYFWDAKGKPVRQFKAAYFGVYELTFAPDSRSLLVGPVNERGAFRYDLQGKRIRSYSNPSSPVTSVGFSPFSPDSLFIVTGGEGLQIRLWDAVNSDAEGFPGQQDLNAPAVFNPEYPVLLIGEAGDSIYQWDLYSSEQRRMERPAMASTSAMAYSSNGEYFLTSTYLGSVQLWRQTDGALIWNNTESPTRVSSLDFSPDGRSFLTAMAHAETPWTTYLAEGGQIDMKGFPVFLRSVDDFSVIRKFGTKADQAVFSPDGNYVATNERYELSVYNSQDAKEICHVGGTHEKGVFAYCLAFAPDNGSVVAGYSDNTLRQYDLKGKLLREFKGHWSAVRSVGFSSDGKYLISGSSDNTAKIWDVASGREIVALMAVDTADWVVITPDGLFDASEGAMKQLYFVAGLEIIELDQLKERYYEPGLLARVMGFAEGGLRKVQDLDAQDLALYPLLQEATLDGDKIKVRLQKRSGGIGNAVVLLDGDIDIIPDANPRRLESFEIDLTPYAGYFIAGQANRLSLIFYNADGWLPSPPHEIQYTPGGAKDKGNTGKPATDKPNTLQDQSDQALANTLYALVVGTTDYAGKDLDLKFPDLDATAYKEALELAGSALFGARMDIKLLTTTKGGTRPTKAAIQAALQDIAAKAEPKDILMVYLSGHGTTWPENSASGQFYYLTADNNSFNFDDAQNRGFAISQDSLHAWIRAVKARKRVLILDACNSGEVVKQFESGAKGMLNSDQRRALERMKDRGGFFVLAGSAADKSSYEDPRFGHGLLTYSLLRNMPKVAAADGKNHYVDVGKLFTEVREDVPKLASELRKVQEPKLIGMEDFSIGIIKEGAALKLPSAKKIITKSAFSNKKRLDPLKLTDAINEQLEQKLASPALPFTFWPVDKAAGLYYFLNGEYEVNGTAVKVTAYFYQSDKDNELKTFTASGTTDQMTALLNDLLGQFSEYLEGMGE